MRPRSTYILVAGCPSSVEMSGAECSAYLNHDREKRKGFKAEPVPAPAPEPAVVEVAKETPLGLALRRKVTLVS